jgi:hypothetical protein
MSPSVTKPSVEPVSSNSTSFDSVPPSARTSELQRYLTTFIQAALQQSRSGHLPVESSLQLLDKAWRMQKLLWQLRTHISSN